MHNLGLRGNSRQVLLLLLGSLIVFVVFQLLFQYNILNFYLHRQSVEQGALWLLFSGHFVHLNWEHLILNWLGWALTVLLFPNVFNWKNSVVVSLLASLLISLSLLIWLPDLHWYCGYSGVIHTMLMVGIILGWKEPVTKLVLFILSAKIIYEMTGGTVSGGITSSIDNVVYESHWFGFIYGIPIGFLILWYQKKNELIVAQGSATDER